MSAHEAAAIRVLVVDDDAGARRLHGHYVSRAPGFVVTATVGTGRAAVQHSLRGDVDLVLLDMRLPDISGIEVLNRLRTVRHASPDVLVISSSRDQVTVRQALAARVIGYLVKPFTESALHARLASYRAAQREAASAAREVALGQGEIDRLQSTGRIEVPAPARGERGSPAIEQTDALPRALPKGISEITLSAVLAALDPVTPLSAVELARQCEISRATARRYLDHLVEVGAIDLAHRYGKRGRPEVLYRLVPPPAG
ncbi:response regulator [Leucobacter sp. USCH14]|uniref:response regulator transcription factor n=1 Tax=Leucobacter sp. USCH14 TaxID=3024838 RepID=UPI0030A92199